VLTYLEDVKSIPLTAPNVDSATNIGMIQAMKPYRRLANVCENSKITVIMHCKEAISKTI
jgi:hypothetical protein